MSKKKKMAAGVAVAAALVCGAAVAKCPWLQKQLANAKCPFVTSDKK